jgi:hypothetical protein
MHNPTIRNNSPLLGDIIHERNTLMQAQLTPSSFQLTTLSSSMFTTTTTPFTITIKTKIALPTYTTI